MRARAPTGGGGFWVQTALAGGGGDPAGAAPAARRAPPAVGPASGRALAGRAAPYPSFPQTFPGRFPTKGAVAVHRPHWRLPRMDVCTVLYRTYIHARTQARPVGGGGGGVVAAAGLIPLFPSAPAAVSPPRRRPGTLRRPCPHGRHIFAVAGRGGGGWGSPLPPPPPPPPLPPSSSPPSPPSPPRLSCRHQSHLPSAMGHRCSRFVPPQQGQRVSQSRLARPPSDGQCIAIPSMPTARNQEQVVIVG